MIPFDPSAIVFYFLLLYAIGGVCALLLLVWWLRLALSPRARQTFAAHRLGRSLLMLGLLAGVVYSIDSLLRMERISQDIAAQIAQEEAERTPMLQQDTVLAGIAMPAGTKLELLHHNAVGEQWVKPEYFEQAEFPQPITWQGVLVTQLNRRLQAHQDNSPASFRTTRVTWGGYLSTELAAPQTIAGFDCQDTANWLPKNDADNEDKQVDAALAAPTDYRLDGCTLAGQDVHDEAGTFGIHAAAGALLFSNRAPDDESGGYLNIWTIRSTAPLSGKHFDLQAASAHLHWERHTLMRLTGQISQAAADCPLPLGSEVEWRHHEPQLLGVYGAAGVGQCGGLRIRPLAQPPL